MLARQTILIIGGSGSLGNQLIETYLGANQIINYSRDENKHWSMDLKYASKGGERLKHVIGDIRDATKIKQTLLRHRPSIIIIAAALKHIDRCEYEINESINTNIIGIQNVLDAVETNLDVLCPKLSTICFISTDKACSPVNVYGMCKSICEGLMVEKAKYIDRVKFVTVRYGNVLNSRGSIIPILETRCQNGNELTLTSEQMTRFIMTLEESVALIEYAILYGQSGEIVIPKLRAMKIKHLFELFGRKYNKPIKITGLRSGEKIHEALINETQSLRTIVSPPTARGITYYHIKPSFAPNIKPCETPIGLNGDYHSGLDNVSKSELQGYLTSIGLFSDPKSVPIDIATRIGVAKSIDAPFPHIVLDDLLSCDVAYQAQQEVLALPEAEWDRYQNPFEAKWTLRDKNKLPPTVQRIFDELNSPNTVEALGKLVGTKLYADEHKHYWGIHKYDKDDYLKIHVDAGVHPISAKKKHVTLGLYLSHCWDESSGCELELWSGESVTSLTHHVKSIPPLFNRCVVFVNTDDSWHGNPNVCNGSPSAKRIFLTVSYLSDVLDQPNFTNKRTRAYFRPRPNTIDTNVANWNELSEQRASETECASVYKILK